MNNTVKRNITVVTPCFNEESNVFDIYTKVKAVFASLPQYNYKHLFIDNASTDNTVAEITKLIEQDQAVQLIVNNRNFGHIRSPYYGILQAEGDAVILIAADLQEPPSLIPEFLSNWEQGYQVVAGVKNKSKESKIIFFLRKCYYSLLSRVAETDIIGNFTGFGIFDRSVLDKLQGLKDPYPYFRGLISELGFAVKKVYYLQPTRAKGISKNNFYTLYDMAMLGFTSHSKVPLRIATFTGFCLSILSLLVSLFYLGRKLFFWDDFSIGVAPIVSGVFFFAAVQLFFIGILGEYVLRILTLVRNMPLVTEKNRVNFSDISNNHSKSK